MSARRDLTTDETTLANNPKGGWLMEGLHDADIQVICNFTPMELVVMGRQVTLPCSEEEKKALHAKLDAHYFAWTGEHLSRPTFKSPV